MTEDQFYKALGYPKQRLPDGTLQQMSPERMTPDQMNSLFPESGGPKKIVDLNDVAKMMWKDQPDA